MKMNFSSKTKQTSIEIIIVGNELLNGTTLDTNSHWLSQRLVILGDLVTRKTTIRDDEQIIAGAFREAIRRRPDWIISLGGLGPTFDDKTLEGLSIAVGKPLVRNPHAVEMLKESYRRRAKLFRNFSGRLLKSSLKMASIPSGSRPLPNPVGSAPAVLLEVRKTRITCLPGVPTEMKAIFDKGIAPILQIESKKFKQLESWLKLLGVSESKLAPYVARIGSKHSLVYVKSHPAGFEGGRSLLRIQLLARSSLENLKETRSELEIATLEIKSTALKLGARVEEINRRTRH